MKALMLSGKTIRIIAAVVLLGISQIVVAETEVVAGQFTASYAKQEALPIPDSQGHVLMLGEATGSNASTNGSDYMDGAAIVNQEILDLMQGNGPHSGYVTMSKDGEQTVTRWEGKVTTTLNKDGSPNTTFKGVWQKVAGTGQYADFTGSGTYQGYFTSETDYTVDWKGKLKK